jgi:transcriptional regulator with XRE-family HTH domain
MERIGKYLKSCREARGLSAAAVAAALGTGESTVYRIERGRDTMAALLLAYAGLVGASGDELVRLAAPAEPAEVAA